MDTPTTTPKPPMRDRAAAFMRRWFRRLNAICIGAVAAVWSFDTLWNLAAYLGFGRFAWMFPLCIDAIAALGMDYWMTRSPVWKLGRIMALFGIAMSVTGNVTDWLLRDVHPLAAAFGFIPPAALAAVLSIAHRNAALTAQLIKWLEAEAQWNADQKAERDRKAAERSQRPMTRQRELEPKTVTKLSPVPDRRELPASDAERLAALEQVARDTGKPPTKRDAMRLLGVGSATALKLTKTVRETVTTETVETGEALG